MISAAASGRSEDAHAAAGATRGRGCGVSLLLADPDLADESVAAGKEPAKLPVGLLAMIAGAFFFSLMALLVKYLGHLGTYELVFWRSVFMFVGTMTILAAKGIDPRGPAGSRWALTLPAVAGFGFMSGYYYALKHLPLSDAVVITYTSPAITAVAAALLLEEAWGRLDALGTALCLVGVVLISKPSFLMCFLETAPEPMPIDGLIGAILASLMSATIYLLIRMLKDEHPMVVVNYFAAASMILSPLFSIMSGETWTWHDGKDWPLLILLGVFSITGQSLTNIGLSLETAAKASAMNYAQVVFAFVFQATLLHEPTDVLSIIGSVMIAAWGVIALVKGSEHRDAGTMALVKGSEPIDQGTMALVKGSEPRDQATEEEEQSP